MISSFEIYFQENKTEKKNFLVVNEICVIYLRENVSVFSCSIMQKLL